MDNENHIFGLIIFVFILITISMHCTATAHMDDSLYPLEITGGEITAVSHHGIISVSEGAVINAGKIRIEADSMEVKTELAVIEAEGDVFVQKDERVLKGKSLVFNYAQNNGILYSAEGKINNINFFGLEINITETENVLDIKEAELTTCELEDHTHYHLKAQKIIIYPEEKLVAEDIDVFLGRTKIFTLPSYIVDYTDGQAANLFPITKLRYDSEDGLVMEMKYQYQYGDRFEGEITADINQEGDYKYQVDNNYEINEHVNLNNRALYADNTEDIDNREFSLEGGIEYNNSNLTVGSKLVRDFLKKEYLIDNKLTYKGDNYNIGTNLKYNFTTQKRIEEIELNYSPYKKTQINLKQQYQNEKKSKESYKLTQSLSSFFPKSSLELIYRKGYETDYLPYLNVKNNGVLLSGEEDNKRPWKYNLELGGGRVENEGINADKVKYKAGIEKELLSNKNYNLTLESSYTGNTYLEENTSNYNIYKFNLDGSYSWDLNRKVQLEVGSGYNLVKTSGIPLIPSDSVDEEELIIPALRYKSYDKQEKAGWTFGVEGEYELDEEQWQSVELKVKRVYDCYNYSLGYDTVNKSYSIDVEF